MNELSQTNSDRELFRHALATLAYRGGKATRNAPQGFAEFSAGHGVRTPGQILAHVSDVLDWAFSIASGKEAWNNATPQPWDKEVERFFAAIRKLDDLLASNGTVHAPLEKLLQGPVADALTHVGQIAVLRRLAGAPLKGEDYSRAEITAGRVGAEQVAPKFEF